MIKLGWRDISGLLETTGSNFPKDINQEKIVLKDLWQYPEKINDDVVGTLKTMEEYSSLVSGSCLTGLIGLGELMKLSALKEEDARYKTDVTTDELAETIYKVGCLVESLGVMIYECNQMEGSAELALEKKEAFDAGEIRPGMLRPDGTRLLEDQQH
jgi:hypothetical protein